MSRRKPQLSSVPGGRVAAVAGPLFGTRTGAPVLRRHRPEPWILLSLLIVAAVAGLDVYIKEGGIAISALVLGPLVAATRLSARATTMIAVYALVVGVMLGVPDDVFATLPHFLHLTTLIAGSLLAILVARARVRAMHASERTAVQSAVAQALLEAPTLAEATPRILESVARIFGWELGVLWRLGRQGDVLLCVETWADAHVRADEFIFQSRRHLLEKGQGLPGRAWERQDTVWAENIQGEMNKMRVSAAVHAGLSSTVAFPIFGSQGFLGVMEFWTRYTPQPDSETLQTMRLLGQQVGSYIERKYAEEVVRDIDARKSAVLESVLDAIVTIDADGRLLEFNPAAERMFGYSADEVRGRTMAQTMVPPALRAAHEAQLRRSVRGAGPHRSETYAMRKDGTEFPVELAITPIAIDGPPLFTAYLRDITEKLRAEQELRAAEEQFRSAFSAAPIGVALISLDGRFLRANGALAGILGRDELDVCELKVSDVSHAEDLAVMPDVTRRLMGGAPSVEAELRMHHADGREVWTQLNANLVRDVDGQPRHLVCHIEDITSRREADEELKAREARFRAIFDTANDAVVIVDDEHRFLNANAATEELYGMPVERLRQHRSEDFLVGAEQISWTSPDASTGQQADFQVRRSDGTVIDVAASATANFLPGRHLIIMRDVTTRRRQERHDRFLAQASRALASSLDFETTLRKVASTAVPDIVDWCGVELLNGRDIEHVAVAHSDARQLELIEQMRRRWPARREDGSGVAQVIRTGEPVLIEHVTDEMLTEGVKDPEQLDIVRRVGMVSLMIAPMTVRGRTIGAITFVSAESGRRFDEVDFKLALELASRCAIAVDNARLFAERSHQARTLQSSLLPPELPHIPGLEVGARYQALGEGNEVGGDFYDLFPTRDGRWALVLGDVCGKGPDAAALTAMTRYTIRVLADGQRTPSEVLNQLNDEILRQRPDNSRFATVALAYLTPNGERFDVTLALGGHPEALKVAADGGVSLCGAEGMIIGVLPEAETVDVTTQLEPGDTMVFYTDGVTDRRVDGKMQSGDDRLRSLVTEHHASHAQEIADTVVDDTLEVQRDHAADDVALMVLKVPSDRLSYHQRFEASPDAVALARQAVNRIRGKSAAVNWSDVSLMVSELASNAVRHGDGDWFELAIEILDGRLRVEVSNPGTPFTPPVREPSEDATGGRGLWIVSMLADRWGIDGATETQVWLECDL